MEASSDDWSSQDTQPTTVNLYPERRRKTSGAETATSKFFTHSKTLPKREVVEVDDDDDDETQTDGDESVKQTTSRKRQMRLDFGDGQLTMKKPLINPIRRNDARRRALAEVAAETITLLPGLLATRPDVSTDGHLCQNETLDTKFCPELQPVTVSVVNMDTIDAALLLQQSRNANSRGKPVGILNMANANHAGGGWKYGALAQEEALCYRSSLHCTLKRRYYPLPDDAVIYSPMVMVIRENMKDGHDLLDFRDPRKLEVISVISCAAVCLPSVKKDANGIPTYAVQADRRLMMEKMRIVLRTAIRNRHRQIVLGALGCGAFGNPNVQVAAMWKAVLQEPDFAGGWWEDVVFAVLGTKQPGDNFRVFHDELDGLLLK